MAKPSNGLNQAALLVVGHRFGVDGGKLTLTDVMVRLLRLTGCDEVFPVVPTACAPAFEGAN